jgi:hypothetical protein
MAGRARGGGSMLGPGLAESHMPDLLTVIRVAWGCGGLNCGGWLARHDSRARRSMGLTRASWSSLTTFLTA